MRTGWVALLAAACAACDGGAPDAERAALPAGASGYVPAALASSERLPERYGFGRPATAGEIAALDIDVRPDGRGLPPGSGTAAQGALVYAAKCAACHGADGEGVPGVGDRLVGRAPGDAFEFTSIEAERSKTIGNYWPYATTLFDYVRRAMPFDRPGSLSDEEVYALTAYLLHRNEIVPADAVLDARSLPGVRMPAHGRFRPDDRESSRRVR